MTPTRKCDWCERTDAITVINGAHACTDHLDNAFLPVGQQIRQIVNLMEDGCEHEWLGPTDDAAPICRKCEKVMDASGGEQG